jgi:hypothetical protein
MNFGGGPGLTSIKSTKLAALQTQSNKPSEQTNIKQINRLALPQRHHPVVLDAQISQDKFKTEVR